MRHAVAVAVLFFLTLGTLSAATFAPLSDAALIDGAEIIISGQVLDRSFRVCADGVIVTDYRLAVDEVLKGAATETIVVTEIGGTANGLIMVIPGSAEYTPGTRVLAFLKTRPDGTHFTSSMALGRFEFRKRIDGNEVLQRNAAEIEILGDAGSPLWRSAEAFVHYVREIAAGRPAAVREVPVAADARFDVQTNAPASSYVFTGGSPSRPLRWPDTPPTGGWSTPLATGIPFGLGGGNQPGVENDTISRVNAALQAWTSYGESYLDVGMEAGLTGATDLSQLDGENSILTNYTGSIPAGVQCDGALGCGIVWATTVEHTHLNEQFYSVIEGDVAVFSSSMSPGLFEAVVGHEVGHAVALIHGPGGSLMSGSVPSSGGLRTYDEQAISTVYGSGPPCVPVTTVTISGDSSVEEGKSAELIANPNGDGPFTYQWYEGSAPDTSKPAGSGKSIVTPPLSEPTSYWVKVTGACGTANSATKTITVTPPCNKVNILTDPVSQTINSGATATLSVGVSGTEPFTYQWYRGPLNNTTNPVGSNSPTYTTPALTATTSYWVRVSNCGGNDTSALATITVSATPVCNPPVLTSFTGSVSTLIGQPVALTVGATASAPLAYQWFEGDSGNTTKPVVGANTSSITVGPFATPGTFKYWVRVAALCSTQLNATTPSPTAVITVGCPQIARPLISVPGVASSRLSHKVEWNGPVGPNWSYEVQQSTNPDFTAPKVFANITDGTSLTIPADTSLTQNTRFYYRVRAKSVCNGQFGDFSTTQSIIILVPVNTPFDLGGGVIPPFIVSEDFNGTASQNIKGIFGGSGATTPSALANETFTVTSDQPWLTITPANGTAPAAGVTFTLRANAAQLPAGSSGATLKFVVNDSAGSNARASATTTVTLPVTISKITPVSPVTRSTDLPSGTLIIPVIAHADGVDTRFQSDVRIANASGEEINYDLYFTPSGTSGLSNGTRTAIKVAANSTFALDDIVYAWFAGGLLGNPNAGTLEIRPMSTASGKVPDPRATIASSRTYAISAAGTLGQFIPALTADRFISDTSKDAKSRISLQQIAQSTAFRTNLGFVEGSGQGVQMLVKAFSDKNLLIAQAPFALGPYEQRQTSFSALFPDKVMTDGRIEVTVTSAGGKASAYASVLDNKTTDPLLVFPEQAARASATRYVVPGVAELNASSNFHTDMRIYNAAATPVTVSLDYFPQAGDATPRPAAVPMTIAAGEMKVINNVLPTLWNLNATGGAVRITSPNNSSLVATARTFSRQSDGGTYGQFIPGVTAAEATGLNERALQVLQLEDSTSFRSNLGIVEVTGSPVTVEVTAHPPDGKTSPVVSFAMNGNEFRQMGRIFNSFGIASMYNGRVSVKVIGGSGRVAAYGSVVDNRTSDPTYVPSQ